MTKIDFILRLSLGLKRANCKPNQFMLLCAIAQLNNQHGSCTAPMVKKATEDSNANKIIDRLVEMKMLTATYKLPKGKHTRTQATVAYVITEKGMRFMTSLLEGGEG